MNNEDLNLLENSLKNYLLNSNEDRAGQIDNSKRMKYRGLSLDLDRAQVEEPAFKVRIGAFEASFRIRDGLKINGSLCGDEKMVIKWYYRGTNQQQLQSLIGAVTREEGPKMVRTNYIETKLDLEEK